MFSEVETPFDAELCKNGCTIAEIRSMSPESAFSVLACGGKRKDAVVVFELAKRSVDAIEKMIHRKKHSENIDDFIELGLLAGNASVSREAVEIVVETVLSSGCDMAVAGVLVFCGNLKIHTEEILPKTVFNKCIERLADCAESGTGEASSCVEKNRERVFAADSPLPCASSAW